MCIGYWDVEERSRRSPRAFKAWLTTCPCRVNGTPSPSHVSVPGWPGVMSFHQKGPEWDPAVKDLLQENPQGHSYTGTPT